MNMQLHKLIKSALICLLLVYGTIQAQSPEIDSLTVTIQSSTLTKDTSSLHKNRQNLCFAINVQGLPTLKSLSLTLINAKGVTVMNLGSYVVKKHTRGFYYVENKAHDKINVLNNLIYFTAMLEAADLKRIKTIHVGYESVHEKTKSVITAMPE